VLWFPAEWKVAAGVTVAIPAQDSAWKVGFPSTILAFGCVQA